jgi:hypothetical protein
LGNLSAEPVVRDYQPGELRGVEMSGSPAFSADVEPIPNITQVDVERFSDG